MEVLDNFNIVADYIAGMNPEKTLALQAPPSMQKRLENLIAKEKNGGLSPEEKEELDHYIVLERLIRLAKANAFLRLKQL
ncbi:MAG: hypothetical protein IAE84_04040 [Saprospiraceae bacterium]|jgi:hypothetical protein|nr:hypothetical protein [Saprospiraceae bacterium]